MPAWPSIRPATPRSACLRAVSTSFGVSVVLGGAGVSLTGNVGFNPRGLPSDGKLRFSQIQQIWNQGQASFFTASGKFAEFWDIRFLRYILFFFH